MRRKHLLLIPLYIVGALIVSVVFHFESLPDIARWAGAGIAVLAMFIFTIKQLQLERDLKDGKVTLITGLVTEKRMMGGRMNPGASSGISVSSRGKTASSSTYFLFIDTRKFNVPSSIYTKVQQGDKVCMEYFEKSQFYLDIHVLD